MPSTGRLIRRQRPAVSSQQSALSHKAAAAHYHPLRPPQGEGIRTRGFSRIQQTSAVQGGGVRMSKDLVLANSAGEWVVGIPGTDCRNPETHSGTDYIDSVKGALTARLTGYPRMQSGARAEHFGVVQVERPVSQQGLLENPYCFGVISSTSCSWFLSRGK